MLGVRFEIPNEHGNLMHHVLKPINIKNYNWGIGEDVEIYKSSNDDLEDVAIFNKDMVLGDELYEFIKSNICYIIFMDLKAFPIGCETKTIDTYEDFLNSSCEIMLFISDCSYVDIYCKDKNMIKELYNNGLKQNYSSLGYITESNIRTYMRAF
ncbi:DUF2691 family protein [Clostridium hydrogeniformans]|uniref:DUF2691 family protein n=1 Tax=Clostridium hydrogeniformans TaxID=349933 RepID=UPI000552D1AD|nr:DUF2691 family protein [Clostridium hydrogeniformans]